MAKKQVSWTREQKSQAAIQYAIEGNLLKIEREQSIPHQTLGGWKDKEWFNEIVGKVRHEKQQEHICQYTQAVDEALAKTRELIPTMKNAKDAMLVACMATDKAQLLQGLPTSIRGDSSTVQALADEFRKLSADHKAIQDSVVATVSHNEAKTEPK